FGRGDGGLRQTEVRVEPEFSLRKSSCCRHHRRRRPDHPHRRTRMTLQPAAGVVAPCTPSSVLITASIFDLTTAPSVCTFFTASPMSATLFFERSLARYF